MKTIEGREFEVCGLLLLNPAVFSLLKQSIHYYLHDIESA